MAHIAQIKMKSTAAISLLKPMTRTQVKSRSSQDKAYYSRLPPHHPQADSPRHQQWTKVAVFFST